MYAWSQSSHCAGVTNLWGQSSHCARVTIYCRQVKGVIPAGAGMVMGFRRRWEMRALTPYTPHLYIVGAK